MFFCFYDEVKSQNREFSRKKNAVSNVVYLQNLKLVNVNLVARFKQSDLNCIKLRNAGNF